MDPDLEQRPRDIQHDTAVLGPDRRGQGYRAAQVALLPGRIIRLVGGEIRDRLGEGVAVRPVEPRRPGSDRRDVDRMPDLVKQLCQDVESPGPVGSEDPRLHWTPAAEVGERDGVLTGSRNQVEADPKRLGVGSQVAVESAGQGLQGIPRNDGGEPPGHLPGPEVEVPRLEERIGQHRPPPLQHCHEPPFQGIRIDPELPGPLLHGRPPRAPGRAAQLDHPAVGASGPVVPVHRTPDRLERAEQSLPPGRILGATQKAQDREPVEGIAVHHDAPGRRAITRERPGRELFQRRRSHAGRKGIVAVGGFLLRLGPRLLRCREPTQLRLEELEGPGILDPERLGRHPPGQPPHPSQGPGGPGLQGIRGDPAGGNPGSQIPGHPELIAEIAVLEPGPLEFGQRVGLELGLPVDREGGAQAQRQEDPNPIEQIGPRRPAEGVRRRWSSSRPGRWKPTPRR